MSRKTTQATSRNLTVGFLNNHLSMLNAWRH